MSKARTKDSAPSARVRAVVATVLLTGTVAGGGAAYWNLRQKGAAQDAPNLIVPVPSEGNESALLRALDAARRAPADPEIAVEAGGLAGDMGRYREALALFERAEKLRPELIPAITGQGQMWSALGRPGKAVAAYRRALKIAPGEAALLLALSRTYIALRDFPEALRVAREAEKAAPHDPDVYRTLSLAYGELVMREESLKHAARACELAPNDPDNWVLQASQMMRGQLYPEAEKSLKRALALDPAHVSANLYYARAMIDGRKTSAADREAFAHLARVRLISPNNSEALSMMGGILSRAGKIPQAVSTLRQAREAAPNDSQVLIALGQALIKNRQGEEGVRLVTKGQQLGPKGVGFLDLEELVRKNPDPALVLRLVDLYERQDMKDQAIHVLQTALRTNTGNARLKQRLIHLQGPGA